MTARAPRPDRAGARRKARLGLAVVALFGIAACSSHDDAGHKASSTSATTGRPDHVTDSSVAFTATTAPGSGSADGQPVGGVISATSEVALRPIVAAAPCTRPPRPPTATSVPLATDQARSRDDATCYLVGAPEIDLTEVASGAGKQFDGAVGGWGVAVTIEPAHRSEVNALLNRCNSSAVSCPGAAGRPGTVALLVDGVVVATAEVTDPDEADGPLTLFGNLNRSDAVNVAAAIAG